MDKEKEGRKPSPDGQGLPSKKPRGADDDEQASPSRETPSPAKSESTESAGSKRVRHPAGSHSTQRSPKKELNSAVLSLRCASASAKQGGSPKAAMRPRTPSPKLPSLAAITEKFSLLLKTPPPPASSSAMPLKSSLKKPTPTRERYAEAAPSDGGARSTATQVTFQDILEGIKWYVEYFFRTFRYRSEVREKLSQKLLEQERRRVEFREPSYAELCAAGKIRSPDGGAGPATSGAVAPVAEPPEEPASITETGSAKAEKDKEGDEDSEDDQ